MSGSCNVSKVTPSAEFEPPGFPQRGEKVHFWAGVGLVCAPAMLVNVHDPYGTVCDVVVIREDGGVAVEPRVLRSAHGWHKGWECLG